MKDKRAALVVGGIGLAGLATYLATRAKAAPPPEGAAASVTIEVVGAESHSPIELVEGESYTVRVTVTNQSTKAGMPWEATFIISVSAMLVDPPVVLIPYTESSEYFAAGESSSFDFAMTVPIGTGGQTGSIAAVVSDPTRIELATATEHLTVASVEITYGASVTIGV